MLLLLKTIIRPEFFDIFGIGVFSFITFLSLRALVTGRSIPKWALVVLLLIGIAGLAVDGAIVFNTYIKSLLI
jgi:hypothetical protein